jgi:hypothetical protein
MVAFVKFDDFHEQLLLGKHLLGAADHVVKAMLTNTAPNSTTGAVKTDVTEITAAAGYPAGGTDIQNAVTQTGATSQMTAVDVTWTASGGSFGPFRYVVLYNDTQTAPAKPLIGYYDYGSSITINDSESFTLDFGTSVIVLS